MPNYSFLSQSEAWTRLGDDLIPQLGQLTALAFAEFHGVVQPSPLKTRWYLARPGMDRELSGVALCEGRIVSNVYVTRLRFPMGGRPLDVGMIDTVITHPQHRRQGLARRLLERALSGLHAAGAAAATLYTPPGSLPFRIYERMGFRLYRPCLVWTRERAAQPGDSPLDIETRIAAPDDTEAIRALVNRYNAAKDGFVALDERLWEWRKLQRAPTIPATVALAQRGSELVGTATFCPVELVKAEGPRYYIYLTDLGLEGDDQPGTLAALLRASPFSGSLVTLAGENDAALCELLRNAGFAPAPTEGCLVHPLMVAAERALEADGRHWYVLPESVVGV